jgi:hypothetical protein
MARVLRVLLSGGPEGMDTDELHRLQDGIGHSLVRLSTIADEAEHERAARLAVGPDTGPLLRMLLRVRHDLVIIGRAAQLPLPEPLQPRLRSSLRNLTESAADYLAACAGALRQRRQAPPSAALAAVFDAYQAEVAAIREQGLTRGLRADAAERFFALGFAFEQLRQNVKDLERCVTEWAEEQRH